MSRTWGLTVLQTDSLSDSLTGLSHGHRSSAIAPRCANVCAKYLRKKRISRENPVIKIESSVGTHDSNLVCCWYQQSQQGTTIACRHTTMDSCWISYTHTIQGANFHFCFRPQLCRAGSKTRRGYSLLWAFLEPDSGLKNMIRARL